MQKFYELLRLPSAARPSYAAALRQAQAHVRKQSAWRHPRYWAAFVLWGAPE